MKSSIIILVVAVLIIGGIFLYKESSVIPPSTPATETPTATSTPSISTTYITPVEWPPVSKNENQPYSCADGTESPEKGFTEKRMIDGTEWCRTTLNEGAAGSTYSQYTYITKEGEGVRRIAFTLRKVQCGNYNDPERSVCEAERTAFNPDDIIASMD